MTIPRKSRKYRESRKPRSKRVTLLSNPDKYRASMNLRHAAALALVGWYLMVPPTREALVSSCSRDPGILALLVALVRIESDSDRIKRCDREGIVLVPDAAFSRWLQSGEFETLADCRAEQQKPVTEKEKALADSVSGLTAGSGVSKEDLIHSPETGLTLSRCLASDDPRLKGNQ